MLPPICDVFQTNLPDLLSVVCFFLRVACQKKTAFPTFRFLHCAISPSTFLTLYGSQLTPVRAYIPAFQSPVRVFSSHNNVIPIPLQSFQVRTTYKPPLEKSSRTIFPCSEISIRAFLCFSPRTTTQLQPYFLQTSRTLKSSLFLFSPVRYQIHYRTGMLPIWCENTVRYFLLKMDTRTGFTNKPLFEH